MIAPITSTDRYFTGRPVAAAPRRKQRLQPCCGRRYLGNAGRAEPVPLGDGADPGPVAVGVAAPVTAVTQQQQLLVVSLPANLAVLKVMRNGLNYSIFKM